MWTSSPRTDSCASASTGTSSASSASDVGDTVSAAREPMAATKREPRMIPLGYGKFVRADRIFAVVPLEPGDRGDRRRTYVHVEGIAQPVVASRSERAILADVEAALDEAAGISRGARGRRRGDQDQHLF